jgi:dTDP-4-amino-4,6-dideoxygalactose transaminase
MPVNLAVFGGDPVTRDPFPPWPSLGERAVAEAAEVLRSGKLTYWSGDKGRAFEREFARWTGARFAVSCSSGTAALHVALSCLGVGPGDEVIVPSHSFIASSFSALNAGARAVFCDVAQDHTMDPEKLESLVGPRTKALVVVHLFGVVADMEPILRVASARGLRVVEDCAQSMGGEYKGRKVGSIGDAGCFSFSQSKHLTTGGEGGMVVTSDANLAREMSSFRDHGYDGGERAEAFCRRPGFNYRLTELQSAIGIQELSRMDAWNLPRRRGYARLYDHALGDVYAVESLPLNTQKRSNAYWQYPLHLDAARLTAGVERIREALSAEGIPCSTIQWREAYREPAFGGARSLCPTAESLREKTLVLPLYPTMDKSHVDFCIAGVRKVLRAFKR